MKTDPVCGMEVDENSGLRAEVDGERFYFCSANCRDRFLKNPQRYLEDAPGEAAATEQPPGVHRREEGRGRNWRDYLPLFIIVGLSLLAAVAKQGHYAGGWDWMNWMHDFMGVFLVIFSMFKLFDLSGFADGFQMYDLLAKRFRPYAHVYPFIELGLGLAFLAHWQPPVVYGATVIVMVFGSLGVLAALKKGLDINCACMGTVLRVPLSTVALSEDLGMAAMAGAMLWVTF